MNHSSTKIIVIWISLLALCIQHSIAQEIITIYDSETLDPISMATVSFSDESETVLYGTTDIHGQIEVPYSSGEIQLQISHVGYETITKKWSLNRPSKHSFYLTPVQEELNEVVVTGVATEIAAEESVANVEIIHSKKIRALAAQNLRDVLMNETNIRIQQDGILGTSINFQGLSGNDVKVMIDGVPVTGRINGNIDLSQINLNNIERIELIEGPMSVVFGTNAIAGTINLITKSSQRTKTEGFINTYYESIGSYNIDGLLGLRFNKHLVRMSGGRYFFDGWSDGNVDRNMDWDPKEQYFGELQYTYRFKDYWIHRLKGNIYRDRILNRYDPTGTNRARDDWYKTNRYDISQYITGRIKEGVYLKMTNAYNYFQRTKNAYSKNLSTLESILVPESIGDDQQDTTQFHQWMSRTMISYEMKDKKVSYQFGYDFSVESGKGDRFKGESGNNATIYDIALFSSIDYKPNEKWTIQPGLRYGYNSQYTVLPTPSLGMRYTIHSLWVLRASYGMGYRIPSLKELYLDFVDNNHNITGNTELSAEQSHHIQASIRHSNSINQHKYWGKINGFYIRKEDGIALAPLSSDSSAFQYVNIALYQAVGFQTDVSYSYKGLAIRSGFAYIGKFNNEWKSTRKQNRFFFSHEFNVNISYTIDKIGLSVNWFNKYTGRLLDYAVDEQTNEVQTIYTEPYHLMDFTVSETFWKDRMTISTGIRNVLGVGSVSSSSASGSGAHSSGSSALISTGRSYFVSLKIGSR